MGMKRKAKLIVYKDGHLLLLKKKGIALKYSLLGGNVKKNETPEKALIREAYEEGAVKLKTKHLDFVLAKLKIEKKTENATYYFEVEDVDDFCLMEPEKFTSIDWIPEEEAMEFLNKRDYSVIKEYILNYKHSKV